MIRIQKYLSQQGLLSRRKAEEYIQKGWIYVNQEKVSDLGTKINPEVDVITFSDSLNELLSKYKYIIYNKPRGIVTNCPQNNEKEIKDLLPKKYQHLSAIGRLDKDSEGLILLTDDGIFSKICLSETDPHEREYLVWVKYKMTDNMKSIMESGMIILGAKTKPVKIQLKSSRLFSITMKEGKNRQIRRMVLNVNNHVVRLKRIRFGNLLLDDLGPNEFKEFKRSNFRL